MITTIISLLIIVLVMWFLIRSFLKPLKSAASALGDVAEGEGDLTRTLKVQSSDEVGLLSGHFNTVITSLGEIITRIKDSLEQLKNSGQELSANMEQTGSAVYEINTNIESTKQQILNQSAGVSEISSTIEQIARNIDSLNGLVDRRGAEQSDGLLEANKVIQNISARTNLLAMNAAIEAAHAGDAGRGFAVVADEIRKLAETSSDQTKNISQVLNSLKQLIDSVVSRILDSGRSFEVVRDSVQDVTTRQEQIKNSMEEMARGTEEINSAVSSVVSLTQENTRGIGVMEQEVKKFTVRGDTLNEDSAQEDGRNGGFFRPVSSLGTSSAFMPSSGL